MSHTQVGYGSYVLWGLSPYLASLMLVVVPTLTIGGTAYARMCRQLSRETQALSAQTLAYANESLANIRTVRAFANEDYHVENFQHKSNALMALNLTVSTAIAGFASDPCLTYHLHNFLNSGFIPPRRSPSAGSRQW
jgi:ATP-binding cassette subfamily B (MDR/TAP) protein 10